MTGNKYGKWTVVGEPQYDKHKIKVIMCRCECGTEKLVRTDSLMRGQSTKCRRCMYDSRESSPVIGLKFGKYTVLSIDGRKNNSCMMLKCQCDCGNIKVVAKTSLTSGKTTQCIKCSANMRNKARAKHNMVGTITYNTWRNMTKRCRDPKFRDYHCYGGRGITVCDRWLVFENFLEDMGERPAGLQLDRINNDGNYEPGNCRWTTPKVNANNRRRTKKQGD